MSTNRSEPIVKFSGNLCFLRQHRRISQLELACDLGIKVQKVIDFEGGRKEPDHQLLLKIGRYFQVGLNLFLEVDLARVSHRINGLIPYHKYDLFLTATHNAECALRRLEQQLSHFEVPANGIERLNIESDFFRLTKVLKLFIDTNWNFIKKIKEYYGSSQEV